MDAPIIFLRRAYRCEPLVARRGIPQLQRALELRVVLSVRPRCARSRDEFPFGHSRQTFAAPLRVSLGSEPRDERDRRVRGRVRPQLQIARPTLQIRFVGEQAFHCRALPARIGADELEEVFVHHRQHIEVERLDGDLLKVCRRTEQRFEHAAADDNHSDRCVGCGENKSAPCPSRKSERENDEADCFHLHGRMDYSN